MANPVTLDLIFFLNALNDNHLSKDYSEDYNAQLTHFLVACGTTNQPNILESHKYGLYFSSTRRLVVQKIISLQFLVGLFLSRAN